MRENWIFDEEKSVDHMNFARIYCQFGKIPYVFWQNYRIGYKTAWSRSISRGKLAITIQLTSIKLKKA